MELFDIDRALSCEKHAIFQIYTYMMEQSGSSQAILDENEKQRDAWNELTEAFIGGFNRVAKYYKNFYNPPKRRRRLHLENEVQDTKQGFEIVHGPAPEEQGLGIDSGSAPKQDFEMGSESAPEQSPGKDSDQNLD